MSRISWPLVGFAAAKHIELDWTDCGDASTHAKIESLVTQPDPLPLGFDNAGKVVTTATLDKDEEGGTYNIKVNVLGKTIADETADFCQPFSFDIKLLGQKLGHIDVDPLGCPAAAGEITFSMGLALSSVVPSGVGGATVSLTGSDKDGESLACVNIDAKIIKTDFEAGAVDCSTATCKSQCECSNDKCASELDACLSDATCAAAQTCALACACDDDACILKCAAANPSAKALTAGKCIISKCGHQLDAAAIDCSTAACPDQCQCGLDKCADSINTCLADDACAKGQACALACACSDTACTLKCAAANPSSKALPVATCLNKNCASVVV